MAALISGSPTEALPGCRRVAATLFLASLWGWPAYAHDAGTAAAGVMGSVVSILPQWRDRSPLEDEPEGSGVVIDDGFTIVTADHLIGNPATILVRDHLGSYQTGEVVARDPATDIALLHIERRLAPIAFATTDVAIGSPVCAIGNSFGLDLSVTCGTVSATGRSGVGFNRIEDFIQTDASVNPGMSGGALVDQEGRLVGILSAIFTKTSDSDIGVNFAVSARLLAVALPRLKAKDGSGWPQPGLVVRKSPERGDSGPSGARVVHVLPERSPSMAVFRVDDVILKADGERVRSPADWTAVLALRAGRTIDVEVLREGKTMRFRADIPG